ncbi:MAG: mechanosensitive ion channel [Sulfolobales archaeon]
MAVLALEEYIIYIIAGIASIFLYVFSNLLLFRHVIRILGKEFLIIARISIALLSISLFLAFTAFIHGAHEIFVLIFSLFVISFLVIIIGARHVLEEYITGIFASKTFDLRVGDYIEIGDIKGYIAALDDTNVIIRDIRRGLIYVPYTMFAHTPFKRAKVEEGYDIRITITLNRHIDLEEIRKELNRIAADLGLSNIRLDIEAIEASEITLSIRGSIKDPRKQEEIRYTILDRLYSLLFPKSKVDYEAGNNP